MKLSTCALLTAVLLAQTGTAEAKAYKGAEVYTIQTALYGRVEIRMRMIRGSGLISTFFTYKNGSETNGTLWEETDIEALGKNDAKSWQSNLITGNPRMTSEQVYTATSSLADGYHTYTLEWTPDYVTWLFDGTMVRKTEGGQASNLTNPETLRFNAWASDSTGWAGALDDTALPAYQFVNWIKYYKYDNGQFVLDWTDEFDSFDTSRWGTGNWTFDGNLVDFDPANAVVQDSTLILAITKEGATGFSGTVPVDDGTTNTDGGVTTSNPHSDSGCAIGGSGANGAGVLVATLLALGLAAGRSRRSRLVIGRLVHRLRRLVVSKPGLTLAALLVGVLVPRAAAAVVQGAELYRTQAYFYGRFEARVRFAPGEGVVSSFFLWKDGSDTAASWDELDFEKINSDCRLQTNIWSGKGAQSAMINTPSFNICNDYHTYAFEWTPDYIAWFIDGAQVRKETGARVTEYAQNATIGMSMHFNIWQGDSSFGGNLNTSTLPVYQYISWAQYSSYANGAFQMQWREDFTGSSTPTNWARGDWMAPLNHSKHNMANVAYVNGIAVLALTNDGATGYTGTPPADPAGGTGGTSGGGGTSGAAGTTGAAGRGGTTGSGGAAGRGGTTGSAGTVGRGGTTGSGGTPGTAGASATGGTPGTAGASATGGTPGTAGSSPTGDPQGTAGSSATGTAGTGDVTGAAGTSGPSGAAGDNPTGSGAGGSGTISGQAGSTGQTGGDGGCACGVGAARSSGATTALLLLALTIGVRRRRRSS